MAASVWGVSSDDQSRNKTARLFMFAVRVRGRSGTVQCGATTGLVIWRSDSRDTTHS